MDAKFSLGQIGVTDYLIIRCRKVSDPASEVARQVFGPAPPTNENIVFVGLDADFYYFDVYESSNGVLLTTLFNTYEINVGSGQTTLEYRYYVVDRGLTGDPVTGTNNLDDPYLNGKTIASFSQRNVDKLRPTDEWTRSGTGVLLVAPLLFNTGDTYVVEIQYPVNAAPAASTPSFSSEIDIVGNVTLDATFYNKLINCNGVGAQLVVTLDHVATVPDNTQFLFVDQEGGLQHQTKFVPQAGEFIKWNGVNMSELWIGKGEFLQIKKRGAIYKVVHAHEGLNMVGLRNSATYKSHVNTLMEDASIYLADDYPRIWWFISTKLPVGSVIIDDGLDVGGYARPANTQGLFIISTTKRKFMMPDTRALSEKGLHDFSNYNTDAARAYDYPGGYQADGMGAPGAAKIRGIKAWIATSGTGAGAITVLNLPAGSGVINHGTDDAPITFLGLSAENIVKNYGVIYVRFI